MNAVFGPQYGPAAIFGPQFVVAGSATSSAFDYAISSTDTGEWFYNNVASLYGVIDQVGSSAPIYAGAACLSQHLSALNSPASENASQVLRYHARCAASDIGIRGLSVTLKQGAMVIASWSHTLTASDTLYAQVLTAEQAASIVGTPISVAFASAPTAT